MTDFYRPKGLHSAVTYHDPKKAYRWLEKAFGFEPRFVLLDPDGNLAYSEMAYGDCAVSIGSEWSSDHRSPTSTGGINTQHVRVQLARGGDIDAHCEHARNAGATIIMEPADQFYGDRTYRAKDPEGHVWTFSVTVRPMTPGEWNAASGLTTKKRLDN